MSNQLQIANRLFRSYLPELPIGWDAAWDKEKNRYYYYNQSTGKKQWKQPIVLSPPDDDPPEPETIDLTADVENTVIMQTDTQETVSETHDNETIMSRLSPYPCYSNAKDDNSKKPEDDNSKKPDDDNSKNPDNPKRRKIVEDEYIVHRRIDQVTVGAFFLNRKPDSKSGNINDYITHPNLHFRLNVDTDPLDEYQIQLTFNGPHCPQCFKDHAGQVTDFFKAQGHKTPEQGGNLAREILKTCSRVKGKDFYPKPDTSGNQSPKELVMIGNTKDPTDMNEQMLSVLGDYIPENVKKAITGMKHSENDFVIVTLPTSANDTTATVWVFYLEDGCHRQKGEVGKSAMKLNIACKSNTTE